MTHRTTLAEVIAKLRSTGAYRDTEGEATNELEALFNSLPADAAPVVKPLPPPGIKFYGRIDGGKTQTFIVPTEVPADVYEQARAMVLKDLSSAMLPGHRPVLMGLIPGGA